MCEIGCADLMATFFVVEGSILKEKTENAILEAVF